MREKKEIRALVREKHRPSFVDISFFHNLKVQAYIEVQLFKEF
jgi:hypothetical protein